MIPFDDEELAYISALDPAADVELLRRELPNLRASCLRTMEVSTTLLKARLWLSCAATLIPSLCAHVCNRIRVCTSASCWILRRHMTFSQLRYYC